MDADLDLLCISVYCTADDLLPGRRRNARRRLSDAEIVTLCVAQVLVGIPSDRRFLRAARRQLGHLFPCLPSQDALHKRRARLAETIEWLIGVFAAQSPGSSDDLLLLDSTPVECGRSLETARRSQLAEVCGYGYSKSHSRWFWGMRLHLACAPDGTPRAAALAAADRPEREVALTLLPRALAGGETIICDRATPGVSSPRLSVRSAHSCCDRRERPSREPVSTSRPFGNGSNRSSGPAKTCLTSNGTAPAPHATSSPGSPPGCSPSPPASASTTNSAGPAELSRPTPPNVASTV
jgi:DDE family transposase